MWRVRTVKKLRFSQACDTKIYALRLRCCNRRRCCRCGTSHACRAQWAARTSAAAVAPSGLAAVEPAQQQARENTVTERGTHWSFCSSSEHTVVTFKVFHVAVRSATAHCKCMAINIDISCIAEELNLMQRAGMHLPAFPLFAQSN